MSNPRLDYALSFAASGYFLHPCKEDKRPHLNGWNVISSNDPEQVKAWGAQFPNCRWGVDCGKSNIFIVDSDKKEGKNGENTLALLQADNGQLPETYTVRTKSGGLHRWYSGKGKTTTGGLGEAVDTRGVGGYAVIPDGVDYVPLNNAPLVPTPTWVINKVGRPNSKERPENANEPAPGVEVDKHQRLLDAVHYVLHEAPGAPMHSRDDNAVAVARRVRDFGLSFDATLRIMQEYWAERADVELDSSFDLTDVGRKVVSAYKYGKNQLGENLPEAVFANISIPGAFNAHDAGNVEEKLIPKREWLLGTWFLKKFMTVTVAPGGTGKSNLSIIEGMALATGRELSGDHVHEKGNVWLHNGEDPIDEIERRVAAACKVHKIKQHELKGRFFFTSGRESRITLVREASRGQLIVDEAAINSVKVFIRENGIVLWIIDPFVDMHEVQENDNGAINRVSKLLSAIADETGCAIHVVHHTRKKSKDGGLTDMDMARGASALLSAARIGRNLNGMSDKDASDFILPLSPSWYVRLDSTKANLSAPTDSTQWYEKVSVELQNGDGVGTLRSVEFERVGSGSKDDSIRRALVEIIEEHGGAVSLNSAADILIERKVTDLKRTGLLKRIKNKVMAHSYVSSDGNEYSLTHTNPGEREGWTLVKKIA